VQGCPMSRAVIVVPCFNEAQRLDLRRFLDFGGRFESVDFLFVNDGSRDRTLELLEALHASNPARFSFLHLARNSGKAEAVRLGMLLALESRPDYVGFWDADLATPLEDIPAFCRVLDHKAAIELVVGIRLPLLGRSIERQSLRRWLGRLFARAASLVLGIGIYDTQCGAKLFRATAQLREAIEQPFLARWTFDVELLARLRRAKLGSAKQDDAKPGTPPLPLEQVIYEFPLDRWRDVAGSKVKASDFFKSFIELLRIYWAYLEPGASGRAGGASPTGARPISHGNSPTPTVDEAGRSDQQRAA
jgi:dolichyl-phosphate beta-glucosyltransferase